MRILNQITTPNSPQSQKPAFKAANWIKISPKTLGCKNEYEAAEFLENFYGHVIPEPKFLNQDLVNKVLEALNKKTEKFVSILVLKGKTTQKYQKNLPDEKKLINDYLHQPEEKRICNFLDFKEPIITQTLIKTLEYEPINEIEINDLGYLKKALTKLQSDKT